MRYHSKLEEQKNAPLQIRSGAFAFNKLTIKSIDCICSADVEVLYRLETKIMRSTENFSRYYLRPEKEIFCLQFFN